MSVPFPLSLSINKSVNGDFVTLAATVRDAQTNIIAQRDFPFHVSVTPLNALGEVWSWMRNSVFEQYALSDIPASVSLTISAQDILGG